MQVWIDHDDAIGGNANVCNADCLKAERASWENLELFFLES
jgi:hypothetical protein